MKEGTMKARLQEVCKNLGISMRQFGLKIGYSESWANAVKNTITTMAINNILSTFPMVNKEYILTGQGEPILDETDTLAELTESHQPESTDFKELCMAYRQDLADAREEIKKLREAYFQLLETQNKLMADYASLQTASLKGGYQDMPRDNRGTKKA